MNFIHKLLLLATAVLCSSADDAQVPEPTCAGCFARTIQSLPETVSFVDGFNGGCSSFPINWTTTRNIELPGLCGDLEGSCLTVKRCFAAVIVTGTASIYGSSSSITLTAINRDCGQLDTDQASLGDGVCGSLPASVTAKCTECFS